MKFDDSCGDFPLEGLQVGYTLQKEEPHSQEMPQ